MATGGGAFGEKDPSKRRPPPPTPFCYRFGEVTNSNNITLSILKVMLFEFVTSPYPISVQFSTIIEVGELL